MKVSEIRDILGRYSLSPNKRYGQNFLISGELTAKIAGLAAGHAGGDILEIGPGLGALTGMLIETGHPVTAVEIDSGFHEYLKDRFAGSPGFTLIHADFLKNPPQGSFDPVVSNLPYYCASEMLFKIAENYSPQTILVMMQSEMAERLSALPGTKAYGAFTVSLGFYYEPQILFDAGAEDFYPAPDVRSSFVKLTAVPRVFSDKDNRTLFHTIVKSAFWARRKTLLSALAGSPHGSFDKPAAAAAIEGAGLPAKVRGEELSIEEFIKLTLEWQKNEKNR